ncbi:Sir2 family NAD-dependent protein deacetylase [Lactobacillus xylocopicola]|uniref:Sir2 family NAD-dependent protein deacetylase n=1 Tax=Lactobacillus xylocopicola TaxID=2976676 RepID=A0ABN6SI53_9LACO|nr:Sir2 family NAD-dependent protein deacetylase [Lactobacillus xylocopicola]BDR59995.1 hypothetical protein KIM322_02560 [Lactobacillus xylocopicola]
MENLAQAQRLINEANIVIVVAGNGLAQLEGLDLLGQTAFDQTFPQLAQEYGVHSVASALELKLASWPEQWLLWSKLIKAYSLDYQASQTMGELKELLANKQYFVATSTFGHFFEQAGFNQKRIFNAFGDWTMMQCSSGIGHGIVSDREAVQALLAAGSALNAALVPKCAICGQPMEIHLPRNEHFYPDTDANTRFRWFLTGNEEEQVAFLELGVDETSPQLLEPIIHLVEEFPQWSYVAADLNQDELPMRIRARSAAVNANTGDLLHALRMER